MKFQILVLRKYLLKGLIFLHTSYSCCFPVPGAFTVHIERAQKQTYLFSLDFAFFRHRSVFIVSQLSRSPARLMKHSFRHREFIIHRFFPLLLKINLSRMSASYCFQLLKRFPSVFLHGIFRDITCSFHSPPIGAPLHSNRAAKPKSPRCACDVPPFFSMQITLHLR